MVADRVLRRQHDPRLLTRFPLPVLLLVLLHPVRQRRFLRRSHVLRFAHFLLVVLQLIL